MLLFLKSLPRSYTWISYTYFVVIVHPQPPLSLTFSLLQAPKPLPLSRQDHDTSLSKCKGATKRRLPKFGETHIVSCSKVELSSNLGNSFSKLEFTEDLRLLDLHFEWFTSIGIKRIQSYGRKLIGVSWIYYKMFCSKIGRIGISVFLKWVMRSILSWLDFSMPTLRM